MQSLTNDRGHQGHLDTWRRVLLQCTSHGGLWSVWPDWAIEFWALFQKLWQQLFCPNCPHFLAIIVKCSKSFILLVKSFLATFTVSLVIFTGHTAFGRGIWTTVSAQPRSSLVKEGSVACQIASPLYKKIGCWIGRLSGKPVTPF